MIVIMAGSALALAPGAGAESLRFDGSRFSSGGEAAETKALLLLLLGNLAVDSL